MPKLVVYDPLRNIHRREAAASDFGGQIASQDLSISKGRLVQLYPVEGGFGTAS